MAWYNLFNNSNNREKDGRCGHKKVYDAHQIKENPNMPSPKAIIYKSELDFISRCILDFPNIETGGELFGFWTQMGTPVVLYAVGPGPNAKHRLTSFVQDSEYIDSVEVELCNNTGLQHIGQWHSHHQLSLAHPSGGDVSSMMRGVGLPGFPRMLLCIGNCTTSSTTINAFNFHEKLPGEYVHAVWDIVAIDSPYRSVIDSLFNNRLYKPYSREAAYGEMSIISNNSFKPTKKYQQHWLTERIENIETMKGFVRSAELLFNDSDPGTEILDSGEPIISIYSGAFRVLFPYGFPNIAPRYVNIDGTQCIGDDRIDVDTEQVWNESQYPIDVRFHEWLRGTLTSTLCKYHKQFNEVKEYDSSFDNPQSNIADKNRFEHENQVLVSTLSANLLKFHSLENGNVYFEGSIRPIDGVYNFIIRIIRDQKYNFISADYKRIIPEIQIEEIPFQSISDISPNISALIAQKVTNLTSELELFMFVSMLIHQYEYSEQNGVNLDEIIKQLISNNDIYEILMRKEKEYLNIK